MVGHTHDQVDVETEFGVVLLQSNKDSAVMHQLSNFICLGLK